MDLDTSLPELDQEFACPAADIEDRFESQGADPSFLPGCVPGAAEPREEARGARRERKRSVVRAVLGLELHGGWRRVEDSDSAAPTAEETPVSKRERSAIEVATAHKAGQVQVQWYRCMLSCARALRGSNCALAPATSPAARINSRPSAPGIA